MIISERNILCLYSGNGNMSMMSGWVMTHSSISANETTTKEDCKWIWDTAKADIGKYNNYTASKTMAYHYCTMLVCTYCSNRMSDNPVLRKTFVIHSILCNQKHCDLCCKRKNYLFAMRRQSLYCLRRWEENSKL